MYIILYNVLYVPAQFARSIFDIFTNPETLRHQHYGINISINSWKYRLIEIVPYLNLQCFSQCGFNSIHGVPAIHLLTTWTTGPCAAMPMTFLLRSILNILSGNKAFVISSPTHTGETSSFDYLNICAWESDTILFNGCLWLHRSCLRYRRCAWRFPLWNKVHCAQLSGHVACWQITSCDCICVRWVRKVSRYVQCWSPDSVVRSCFSLRTLFFSHFTVFSCSMGLE